MAKKKKNNGMINLRPNMMWLWTVVFISVFTFQFAATPAAIFTIVLTAFSIT